MILIFIVIEHESTKANCQVMADLLTLIVFEKVSFSMFYARFPYSTEIFLRYSRNSLLVQPILLIQPKLIALLNYKCSVT